MDYGQAWLEGCGSSGIDGGNVRSLRVGEWRGTQMWDFNGQKRFHRKQAGCMCREVPWLKNQAGESESESRSVWSIAIPKIVCKCHPLQGTCQ